MDLSFSVQALGCHLLASKDQAGTPLAPGVHQFPADLDDAIARAKLASRGITLDALEESQTDTLSGLLDVGMSERTEQTGPDEGGGTR